MNEIPLFKVAMSPSASKAVGDVLMSGFIGQGKKVEEFEALLKERFNTDHLVTVNSATSAEHLAFHLLKKYGLEPGDEVLTTALTCTATNWPILHNGFKPKWVDIDPNTLNMDLEDLERKITPKTKVLYLTHWSGYPNDIDKVRKIADNAYKTFGFRPFVIEDCAHAWGSTYKGRLIGTHGNLCTFSFQAIKHLTTGDGGMLVAPGWDDFHKRAKLLRWYGIDRDGPRTDFRCEEDVIEAGFKFHMNDINAAIGIENLKTVNAVVLKHQFNAMCYDAALTGIKGLTLLKRHNDRQSSSWIYSMLVEDRASFTKMMKEKGITVSQVHERNDKHTCVKEYRSFLPNLDATVGKLTHIPVGWWVTAEDRERIIDAIKGGW